MRKVITILLSCIVIAILLVGCGSGAISKMKTKDLMNVYKTKKIGEYGEATYDPDKLTDEDLIKFYNDDVKNSGLNFVKLVNKDNENKGMVFTSSSNILSYGTFSDDGSLISTEKTRVINGDKIDN